MKMMFSLLLFLSTLFQPNKKDLGFIEYCYRMDPAKDWVTKDFITDANSNAYACYTAIYDTEKKYEIFFLTKSRGSDISCRTKVSYGTYVEKGDTLICTDGLLNYQMYIKKTGNAVTLIKSFPNWENRVFSFSEKGKMNNFPWYDYNISRIKAENKKKYKETEKFSYGVYICDDSGATKYLEIDSTGYYNAYAERVLLSTGTWEQKGSELLLKDSFIDAVYSVLISTEGLVSQLMPGDLFGILLKKKQ